MEENGVKVLDKLVVGLIGYGVSGAVFHGPLLRSDLRFELKKVCSSDPSKVLRDFPKAQVVPHIEEVLKDSDVKLVIITAPNIFHFKFAKMALEAGKHVVLEKPFVTKSSEGQILLDLACEKGLMLSVYQNRRWDGDFLTVKKCIKDGLLGDISLFESHFDRFRPAVNKARWREQDVEGAGILFDLGSHLIDQAVQLFGLPMAVTADVVAQRDGAVVDDYFHLILKYEKRRVILHSSSVVKVAGPRFILHGTQGSFVKYGLDPQEEDLKKGKVPRGDEFWGHDNEKNYGEFNGERIKTLPGRYLSFYEGVYEAITKKIDPPVLASDGLTTIKIIEMCMESSKTGMTQFF